jgi:hypothetical protein
VIEDENGNTETIKTDFFGNTIIEDRFGNVQTIRKW